MTGCGVVLPPSSSGYNSRLGTWTLGDANAMRLRKCARDIVAKSSETSVSSVDGVLTATERTQLSHPPHLLSLSTFHSYFFSCNANPSRGTVSPILISDFVVHLANLSSYRRKIRITGLPCLPIPLYQLKEASLHSRRC